MTSPAETARGRIHDIGYRHYDGPRRGRGWIVRSLFVETALGAYGIGRSARTKLVPMLLLATMCLPAVILAAITAAGNLPELPIGYLDLTLTLQVVISIFVAAQAPVAVSRDLRHRVVSLYFSRPISRPDYVAAKLAALSAAVFVLIAAPLLILLAGALLAGLPVGDQVLPFLRGITGALVLAVTLSALGLLIAALTPRRGLGVAAIVAVLVVLSGVQNAATGIALQVGPDAAGWFGLLSPYSLVDGAVRGVLGGEGGPPLPDGVLAGGVFVTVVLALVAGCWLLLLRRYRGVSVS